MKKETGITLVSLVVTIIILIILAGISMNTLVGDKGIITKAQQAKENTLLAQEEEAEQLNQLYSQLNYIGGNPGDIEGEAIDKLLNFKKVIATAISNEGIITQETDSAEIMASNIGKILQERTKDATATAEDIKEGKTAWVNGNKIIGINKQPEVQKSTQIVTNASLVGEAANISKTHDMTELTNYQELTTTNFIVQVMSFTGRDHMTNSNISSKISQSYNANTGILTISLNKTLQQWGIGYNVWVVY